MGRGIPGLQRHPGHVGETAVLSRGGHGAHGCTTSCIRMNTHASCRFLREVHVHALVPRCRTAGGCYRPATCTPRALRHPGWGCDWQPLHRWCPCAPTASPSTAPILGVSQFRSDSSYLGVFSTLILSE